VSFPPSPHKCLRMEFIQQCVSPCGSNAAIRSTKRLLTIIGDSVSSQLSRVASSSARACHLSLQAQSCFSSATKALKASMTTDIIGPCLRAAFHDCGEPVVPQTYPDES
jgi:hypothetical protein